MTGPTRPAYLTIADDLRSRIRDGALRSGDQLPTEQELMADYGVSRIVVRQAIDVLRTEGLVISQQGRGTFVRQRPPQQERVVGNLYGTRATTSPFATATRAAGKAPEWEYQSRRTTATKAIAERLGIPPGDPVMKTSYRFFADDEPVMLSTSYEPLALTEGTPIEQPEAGPVTGVVPRFDTIGVHIDHVVERVYLRSPHPFEAEALRLPSGDKVQDAERIYYADGRAVETANIVAGERYVFTYVVPITPRDQG